MLIYTCSGSHVSYSLNWYTDNTSFITFLFTSKEGVKPPFILHLE